MNDRQKGGKKAFDATDYPALHDYLPGYLHQDFGAEYGTAAAAVKGLVDDASDDEILQVKKEWKALRTNFAARPIEEMRAALVALGCAWRPASEEELKRVDEVLSPAKM
jgi:CdiI immunity protein